MLAKIIIPQIFQRKVATVIPAAILPLFKLNSIVMFVTMETQTKMHLASNDVTPLSLLLQRCFLGKLVVLVDTLSQCPIERPRFLRKVERRVQ